MRREIVGLNGLRGLAALCVIWVHTSAHFSPEVTAKLHLDFLSNGMPVFFVLSGFLIYLPYVASMLAERPMPSSRRYVLARLRRIVPGYVVIFLVANFVLQAVYLENPTQLDTLRNDNGTGMITDPLTFLVNFFQVASLFPQHLQTGLNPSWSITTEYTYYILLLGLIYLAYAGLRRRPGRALLWTLMPAWVLIAVGAAGRVVIAVTQSHHSELTLPETGFGDNVVAVMNRSILAFGENFGFGMLAAVVFVLAQRRPAPTTQRLPWHRARVTAIVVGLLGALVCGALGSNLMSTFVALAASALILVMVLPQAHGEPRALAVRFDVRPLKHFGKVSFGTYLLHYPIIILLSRFDLIFPEGMAGTWANIALVTVLSGLAGTASYALVESRFLTVKEKKVRVS